MRRHGLAAVLAAGLIAASCGGDEAVVPAAPSTSAGETVAIAGTTTQVGAEATAAAAPVTMPELDSAVPIDAGSLLLREDFQDAVADGWDNDGGWYPLTIDDRVVWAASDQAWAWYAGGFDWSDYALRLAFRTEEGGLAVSVGAGEAGRYVVQIAPDGVFLLRDAPYGAFTPLASAAPVAAGAWHVLAVGYQGDHLQVYVDRVLLIDHRDPAPLGPGTVALGNLPGSYAAVDNVIVTTLGGPLPDLMPALSGYEQAPDLPEAPDDPGPDVDPPGPDPEPPDDPALANLEFGGLTFIDLEPDRPFSVMMTVYNHGGTDASGFVVDWEVPGAGCRGDGWVRAGSVSSVLCDSSALPAGDYEWTVSIDPTGTIEESDETDNIARGMIEVPDGSGGGGQDPEPVAADLIPAWTAVSPEAPQIGDTIALQVGVAQPMAVPGPLPAYTVRVSREGDVVCSYDMFPGDEVAVCEIPPMADPGVYFFDILIDADDDVYEGDFEDNNGTWVAIEVLGPGGRQIDLWMTLGGHRERGVGQGMDFRVDWFDLYEGGPTDDPFLIQVDVEGFGVLCQWETTLVPGGDVCPIPGWDRPGEYTITAVLDPTGVVPETDTGDNVRTWDVVVE